ncbi:MAG: penicillin-binding protein 1A [Chromatiales bacterium]|jgi:penicillin-binding protein 1A
MTLTLRLLRWGLIAFFGLFALALVGVIGTYVYLAPTLPSVESLKEIQLQVPLRVLSRDGRLIAEYGEKRRSPLELEQIPSAVRQAFLAAEDDRFYQHPGVDYQGVVRAALNLLLTGERSQGASTITMQLARNFFLSSEKTYTRKIKEVFLALRIERQMSKDQILELYLNKIYLGNRAYGVAAAAQVYYGTGIEDLSLPQMAMIAGLPKAPSRYNPLVNPERAQIRRDYVLGRMRDVGFIDQAVYQTAVETPLSAGLHSLIAEVDGAYVGEMVRAEMVERFGDAAYTEGFRVHTTIDSRLQTIANQSIRQRLLEYDLRHGYRGPEARFELADAPEPAELDAILDGYYPIGGLSPGLVLAVSEIEASVYLGEGQQVVLPLSQALWAKRYVSENVQGPEPAAMTEILARGDLIRVVRLDRAELEMPEGDEQTHGDTASAEEEAASEDPYVWALRQLPDVSGAVVSLRPRDGAMLALVGGFDFFHSKFNRAVQAERQPGSAFKPFIYSAALEKDFTPATIVNDAPVVFEDDALEATWRPENYSGRFYGPTRLRVALTKSRNLVSIRVLRSIGVGYALRHAGRFGFRTDRLPRDLSLALGSGTVTPLELARGYAVFANGGYLVEPYVIDRIENAQGEIVYQASPKIVCPEPCEWSADEATEPGEGLLHTAVESTATEAGEESEATPEADVVVVRPEPAPQVLPAENAYQMVSMMQDVIRAGTGRGALVLQRGDLAGKTGTTNDQNDAWFSGFNADVATTAWVGFDRLRPLGAGETGARAALPIWIDVMRVALEGLPERSLTQPQGMVTVKIDPETGLLATADTRGALFETFRGERVPQRQATALGGPVSASSGGATAPPTEIPEQLF